MNNNNSLSHTTWKCKEDRRVYSKSDTRRFRICSNDVERIC